MPVDLAPVDLHCLADVDPIADRRLAWVLSDE